MDFLHSERWLYRFFKSICVYLKSAKIERKQIGFECLNGNCFLSLYCAKKLKKKKQIAKSIKLSKLKLEIKCIIGTDKGGLTRTIRNQYSKKKFNMFKAFNLYYATGRNNLFWFQNHLVLAYLKISNCFKLVEYKV